MAVERARWPEQRPSRTRKNRCSRAVAEVRNKWDYSDWRRTESAPLGWTGEFLSLVLKTLKESNQLPPTLILTTFDDDNLLLEGIRAGARGFLLKDVTLKQLTEAIRTLKAGGTPIKPAITESCEG